MAVLSRIITICVLFAALRTGLAAPPCKTRSHTAPSATYSQPGEQIPTPVNNPTDPTNPTLKLNKPVNNLASTPSSDKDTFLQAHNVFRAKYGAPALQWDDNLATTAAAWASQCKWTHSNGPYGENLASGFSLTAQEAVNMWTSEAEKYVPNNFVFEEVGHFTQVVWKSTARLGCALHFCKIIDDEFDDMENGTIGVCNYDPPGNYDGQYDENVQPKPNPGS